MTNWVSCEERLPECEKPVLIALDDKTIRVGELFAEYESWREGGKDIISGWVDSSSDQELEWYRVTHWMPLPLPPGAK